MSDPRDRVVGDMLQAQHRQEVEIERLRAQLAYFGKLHGEENERQAAEIGRLRALNAGHLTVLVAILEAVRDNDMFRVGQYVTAALAKAKDADT